MRGARRDGGRIQRECCVPCCVLQLYPTEPSYVWQRVNDSVLWWFGCTTALIAKMSAADTEDREEEEAEEEAAEEALPIPEDDHELPMPCDDAESMKLNAMCSDQTTGGVVRRREEM